MRTSAIPVDQAIELHKALQSWDKVAYALFEQTGRHYSPSTIRHIVYRRNKGIADPKQSNWTDERIELLKKLQAAGLSASKMAFELERTGHCFSRNAVISELRRLGLRAESPKRAVKKAAERSPLPAPKRAKRPDRLFGRPNTVKAWKPPPRSESQKEVILGSMRLTDFGDHPANAKHCRWPINDPPRGGEHLFCGMRTIEGLPYCDFHSRMAYQPVHDKRRDRQQNEMLSDGQ